MDFHGHPSEVSCTRLRDVYLCYVQLHDQIFWLLSEPKQLYVIPYSPEFFFR